MTTSTSTQYNEAQAAKAVTALKAYLANKKPDTTSSKQSLFDAADESDLEDGVVGVADPDLAFWLVVTTKKFLVHDKKTKQERIALPNPYLTTPSPTFTVCVITKDPSIYYRSLVAHLPYHSTSVTIISPSKLKTHYKTFEARRQLERAHDIFLADDRVIPLLPTLLGKSIYRRSAKVPIPIKLSKIDIPSKDAVEDNKVPKAKLQSDAGRLQKEIEKAVRATYFIAAPAASQTIKVGIRSQDEDEIAGNVTAVMEHLTANMVNGGWNGVRSVHIKAAETVALPVWLTDSLFDKEDVLTEEEIKKIEYRKTDEGKAERRLQLEEKKKEKKKGRDERKAKKRNWDSDAESGEDQYFVKKLRTKEPGSKKIEAEPAAKADEAVENAKEDNNDDSDGEDGGVKLPQTIDLSDQAKKLKIGDKRIAPPAPALKTDKKKGGVKDKLKRKASKPNIAATKSKKSKAYQ